MKKILLYSFFCLAFNLNGYSQCNVVVSEFGDFIAHRFANEQIADFIECENGALFVSLEVDGYQQRSGTGYLIEFKLSVGNIPVGNLFAPREITLKFTDNSDVTFSASKYNQESSDPPLISYTYDVKTVNLTKLLQQETISIVMFDERLNQHVTFTPYKGIFRTQVKCVLNSILSNLGYKTPD